MARYRRVNIDGKSLFKTETRITAAALLPGTFVSINGSNAFAQLTALRGRMYVLEVGYHQGLGIRDPIPLGDSAVGNYIEEGREFAALVGPGTYAKDTPLTLGTDGRAAIATEGNNVFAYSQDAVVIAAGATDYIRIRIRKGYAPDAP